MSLSAHLVRPTQVRRAKCVHSFYPQFQTSGHRTVYGILRAAGNGRPHAPKSEGAQARPTPGGSSSSGPLGRELPARTGELTGHTRRMATLSSAPRPPGRSRRGLVARRGGAGRQAGRDGAARGRLARESGLGSPIDLRCAGWWAATERCVGAGAEGWRWEGCGRPAERDARDHALGRRRRKRPLADLAAQASGVPAHASWRACVIGTAGRGRVPSEQVVRLTAAAVERPHCSTSHDGGNWAPSRSS